MQARLEAGRDEADEIKFLSELLQAQDHYDLAGVIAGERKLSRVTASFRISVASEDVHADKGARLVHDLVRGRRVGLRLSGHVRALGRSFDHRYLGCGPDRLLAKIAVGTMAFLGAALVEELVGRHCYQ